MEGSHAHPTGLEALRRELGGRPPKGVAALGDGDLRTLAEAVDAARAEQRRAMAEAGEAAFNHIPRLLRIPLRKLIGS